MARHGRLLVWCLVLGAMAWGAWPFDALGEEAATYPRILLVGDSWTGFMWGYRSFSTVLAEYGLTDCGERGLRTAIMGAKADDFTREYRLQLVEQELIAYPTLDIVHISLGGNDLLSGNSVYSRWRPTLTQEEEDLRFQYVADCIEIVIDRALAVRPDIKIGISSYDYGNHTISGSTLEQANRALTRLDAFKMDLAQRKERCTFLHNFGLMAHYYGIPDVYDPGDIPLPDGPPAYANFPNGDPAYAPHPDALLDNDIHLSQGGYEYLAQNCVDQCYLDWLALPRVLSVAYAEDIIPETPGEVAFEVLFNRAVTGVDVMDFEAVALGEDAAKEPAVTGLTGDGTLYTVYVALDDAEAVRLDVLDDDSILDDRLVPLGGEGIGNGEFTGGGQYPPEEDEEEEEIERYCGSVDFDPIMNDLDAAIRSYIGNINLGFTPEICDLNGPLVYIVPTANGMLEAAEFGLIMTVLNNPDLDLSATGGITHETACAAWTQNVEALCAALDGPNMLVQNLLPGLEYLLAGYMTIGDQNSVALPTLLLVLAASEAPYLGIGMLNPNDCEPLPEYFSADGDADGDGYTNREEYDAFAESGLNQADYFIAALEPTIYPGSGTGAPDLAVDRNEVTLSYTVREAGFDVLNLGMLTLDWTLECDTAEVEVSPESGINGRTVSVSTEDFSQARTAIITCTNVDDPADVEVVTVHVLEPLPSDVGVDVTSLSLSEGSPSGQFLVSNLGELPLQWTAACGSSAVEVAPAWGEGEATVTVTAVAFTEDVETAVTITNDDDPADVETVVVQVAHTPVPSDLSVLPEEVSLSESAPAQTVAVSNLGEMALSWTAESDTPGVTVSPDSGVGGADVSIEATGFDEDMTAVVTFSNTEDEADTVQVTVTVIRTLAPADLTVNRNALTLSSTHTMDGFLVQNLGEAPLTWTVTCEDGSLTISPASGVDEGGVWVRATNFDADRQTSIVVVNAADESDREVIDVAVAHAPLPSDLMLSANALTLSEGQPSGQVEVLNAGEQALDWEAASDTPSVVVSPPSGSGQTMLTITATDFSADVSAVVTVTNSDVSGDSETVLVEVVRTPAPADLDVSANAVNLSASSPSADITILNLGEASLSWRAESSDASVTVSPSEDTDEAAITITASDFSQDVSATITVVNTANNEDTDTIAVTVSHTPLAADLEVTPGALQLSEDSPTAMVSVANAGELPLSWTAESDTPEVTVSPASGSGGTEVTLGATDFSQALTATVTFTNGDDAEDTAAVTVTVVAADSPADLSVSPSTLSLSEDSPTGTVHVENVGGMTLNWVASSSDSSVAVSPSAGSGNAQLTVTATDFSADVTVDITVTNSADGEDTETVTVYVAAATPEEPTLSCFGESPSTAAKGPERASFIEMVVTGFVKPSLKAVRVGS